MPFKEPTTFAERLAQAQFEAEASANVSFPNGRPDDGVCPWDKAQVRNDIAITVDFYEVIEYA